MNDKIEIPVEPPGGFAWPWDEERNRPVLLGVPGAPVPGTKVARDGTVMIDGPHSTTHAFLNHFDPVAGLYSSFLGAMGDETHKVPRWAVTWAAAASVDVFQVAACGLVPVRRDGSQVNDGWKNLSSLAPKAESPDYLSQEDIHRAELTHCENHFHSPRERGSWDGSKIRTGTDCMLPDGNRIKTKKKGTKSVSYLPATGETQRKDY
ncbi:MULTISPECIES: hypothetical protein [Streptomyces]|uniref:Uncharacterized protein n=1 Tax=Streptomyces sp. CMC78 TaxID=3231512 RepID=A0AB33K6T4_9ACTN